MTAAKFKPLIFSVLDFVLSNVANILLVACYVIINVRNLESYMHITNQCVSRKIANGAEYTVCVCVFVYIAVVKMT
jgi:hypothetical protein